MAFHFMVVLIHDFCSPGAGEPCWRRGSPALRPHRGGERATLPPLVPEGTSKGSASGKLRPGSGMRGEMQFLEYTSFVFQDKTKLSYKQFESM